MNGSLRRVLASLLRGIGRGLLSWLLLWTLVFFLLRLLSPDPVTIVAGFYTDEVTRQFLETEFGLKSASATYLDRLSKVLLFDFGKSWRSGRSAVDLLSGPLNLSMTLTVIATLVALTVSVITFIAMATSGRRMRFLGGALSGLAAAVSTVPGFLLALLIASSRLPAFLGFPAHGIDHQAYARSLLFPALCIALPVTSYSVLRILACYRLICRSPWLRGSLAAGGSWNSSILWGGSPYIAAELLDIVFHSTILALTGAVAVEVVLGLPGLGITMLDAIELRDDPVILAVVGFIGALTIVLRGIKEIGQELLVRSIE